MINPITAIQENRAALAMLKSHGFDGCLLYALAESLKASVEAQAKIAEQRNQIRLMTEEEPEQTSPATTLAVNPAELAIPGTFHLAYSYRYEEQDGEEIIGFDDMVVHMGKGITTNAEIQQAKGFIAANDPNIASKSGVRVSLQHIHRMGTPSPQEFQP